MPPQQKQLLYFEGAKKASTLLQMMSNERRLMMLCMLMQHGEMTVRSLVEEIGLSQSAVSQHLAKMGESDIISYRREAQTLYYSVKNPAAKEIVSTLKSIYCPDL